MSRISKLFGQEREPKHHVIDQQDVSRIGTTLEELNPKLRNMVGAILFEVEEGIRTPKSGYNFIQDRIDEEKSFQAIEAEFDDDVASWAREI